MFCSTPDFTQPIPLPPNPFNQPPCLVAYDYCLRSQNEAATDPERLMYARCLGHLLREAPDEGQNMLANEINACAARGTNIDKLARCYIEHLFRLFRQDKGHTPAPLEHSSRPSFLTHSPFFSVVAEPVPTSRVAAKRSALRRDGYRCMVTHGVDAATYRSMTDDQRQEHGLFAHDLHTITNFCHVFPPSTNWNLKLEAHDCHSSNLWSIVNCFGSMDVLAELNGANMHRLSNGLTMDSGLHRFFDNLLLWFEAVPDALDTYTVRTADPVLLLSNFPNPLVVTFTTTAVDLELPDPKYLGLHAAVCRVAHMSGAAGYLELFDRKAQEATVMAHDGSSADLLASRLSQVALVASHSP